MLTVDAATIEAACRRAGLAEKPVGVHAALSTFGWVTGGGATVVRGLRAAGCTVLTPAFSWSAYAIAPPPHLRPPRNGWDYGAFPRRLLWKLGQTRIFTPDSQAIDPEMGALPAALLADPARRRSIHALCSFAAVGPLAASLTTGQSATNVFAPLRRLAAADGWVVLMGVGLTRMTILHEAERQAGRKLLRRWAYAPTGDAAMFAVGGCSEGFENLAPHLAHLERRITVGRCVWRIYPAQATLDAASAAIRAQPELTHCADRHCTRCRDTIAGGPRLAE
ncbi:MAG: AAC(3) family N-acetyltransferase [Litorilinea sp.]